MNDKAYLDHETHLFLTRYRAQFVDSPIRRRRTYLPTYLEDYRMDSTTMDQYMQTHTEPLVTVEIPHSALDVIVENDNRYNELLKNFMAPSYRGDMTDSQRREHYLKRNNKAVRKAWDHYQLMLKLAWEGKDVG